MTRHSSRPRGAPGASCAALAAAGGRPTAGGTGTTVALTLADAVDRALRDQPSSRRGARSADGRRGRRSDVRAAGRSSVAGGAGRLHADQRRPRVRRPPAGGRVPGGLSRHSRQLPHAPRPAVADLHRRPRRRAGAGRRSRGRRRRRRTSPRRASTCDSRSSAPTGRSSPRARRCACSRRRCARRRTARRRAQRGSTSASFRRTTSPTAEAQRARQEVPADRGAQPARRHGRRPAPSHRPAARNAADLPERLDDAAAADVPSGAELVAGGARSIARSGRR